MIRIKVCGITRLEDALLAVNLGAYALGFIFYPPSPRFISPPQARVICQALPPFVAKVGVFVDEDPYRIREIKRFVGLDLVQLHGQEPPEVVQQFSPYVIKAFRVRKEEDLAPIPLYKGKVCAILLDTYVQGQPGGTGQRFDWSLALRAKGYGLPLILAGGLDPWCAPRAWEEVRPYALDVNSGVEIFPGKKSPILLRRLFQELQGLMSKLSLDRCFPTR